ATLTTATKSSNAFGFLDVGGTAGLNGTLKFAHAKSLKPPVGTSFSLIGAGSVTGTFTKASGASIAENSGTYFAPNYSATSVTLVVQKAKLNTPSSALRGSSVAIAGSGRLADEQVDVTSRFRSTPRPVTARSPP